ncbi:hypothetical protein ANCCEY_13260 [Ancylostoma ceylanicum]|uniref:Uncharacterized protein n=1 Tax=Ancylostoma ceylanicum TaxID=53326 RepID=A0A0D6LCS2_9BILA|nr:hypothetical protein ANCCEY_13260 [Ancylostoma ceylanicum]
MTGCRVAAAAGLLLLVALVSAHTEIRPKSDPLCIAARCKESDVCVVKNGEPQCISKQKIIKLARKHGLHHLNKHHPAKPHHKHQKHEEHAQHDRLGQHKCTHDELMSMGGRLLQWFSDMHRIHSGRDRQLPEFLEFSFLFQADKAGILGDIQNP